MHCAYCGRPDAEAECSSCLSACYCGLECQRAHWPSHKSLCKLVASSLFEDSLAAARGALEGPRAPRGGARATKQDAADAAFAVGVRLQHGQGTQRDLAAAADWYLRAARLGHAASAHALGVLHLGAGAPTTAPTATAFPRNVAAAAECFRFAADAGIPESQYKLARLLTSRNVGKSSSSPPSSSFCFSSYADPGAVPNGDDAQALALFVSAARSGHAKAQLHAALMYSQGRAPGLTPAECSRESAFWFRAAAGAGIPVALYNAALLLLRDPTASKSHASRKEAAEMLYRAAEAGFAPAAHNLGVCFARGIGVDRDPRQAAHWIRRAAQTGKGFEKASLRALLAIQSK
jgi:TPR repeat protein